MYIESVAAIASAKPPQATWAMRAPSRANLHVFKLMPDVRVSNARALDQFHVSLSLPDVRGQHWRVSAIVSLP